MNQVFNFLQFIRVKQLFINTKSICAAYSNTNLVHNFYLMDQAALLNSSFFIIFGVIVVFITYTIAKKTNKSINSQIKILNNRIPVVEPMEGIIKAAEKTGHKYDHLDSPYYPKLDFYNSKPTETLEIIPKFKIYQQTSEYSCGPSCALMVLTHFGITDVTEAQLAKEIGTLPLKGSNTAPIRDSLEKHGLKTESSLDSSSKDLFKDESKGYMEFVSFIKTNIQQNHPIIIENVEWGGHWMVIIGIDDMGKLGDQDDVLILADPYDTTDHYQSGYIIRSAIRFYSMWFDHHCLDKENNFQQFIVAWK